MNTRLLTAFGVVDLVIGVAVWLVFDTVGVGLALIAAGIAVLVVAAVGNRGAADPEDRPPPTDG